MPVKDIFELLCAYSQRPYVDEQFTKKRDGRAALRLASWNLTAMTADKAENPGVREVVCRTVLENRSVEIQPHVICFPQSVVVSNSFSCKKLIYEFLLYLLILIYNTI